MKKAFTLVEIIISITIVAIIGSLSVYFFMKEDNTSEKEKFLNTLTTGSLVFLEGIKMDTEYAFQIEKPGDYTFVTIEQLIKLGLLDSNMSDPFYNRNLSDSKSEYVKIYMNDDYEIKIEYPTTYEALLEDTDPWLNYNGPEIFYYGDLTLSSFEDYVVYGDNDGDEVSITYKLYEKYADGSLYSRNYEPDEYILVGEYTLQIILNDCSLTNNCDDSSFREFYFEFDVKVDFKDNLIPIANYAGPNAFYESENYFLQTIASSLGWLDLDKDNVHFEIFLFNVYDTSKYYYLTINEEVINTLSDDQVANLIEKQNSGEVFVGSDYLYNLIDYGMSCYYYDGTESKTIPCYDTTMITGTYKLEVIMNDHYEWAEDYGYHYEKWYFYDEQLQFYDHVDDSYDDSEDGGWVFDHDCIGCEGGDFYYNTDTGEYSQFPDGEVPGW